MELIIRYSGIIAIIVYSLILVLILKFSGKKEKKKDIKETLIRKKNDTPLDPDDEDATIACLVAAIECRNETKKNVRIVSVREVR